MDPTTTPETSNGWRGVVAGARGLLILTAVVALVVGLAAGFAIGFKVEQSRVKSDVNRLKDQVAALKRQGSAEGTNARSNVQLLGHVRAVDHGLVTMTSTSGKSVKVNTASATVYTTTDATVADIAGGAKVMFRSKNVKKNGAFDGNEIIVLRADSPFGRQVTTVDPGSLTITNAKGKLVKINTANPTLVRGATVGTAADITQNATITVSGERAEDGRITANEVLVLPVGSRFEALPKRGR
jgi:purine nucleoside permease